MPRGLAAVVVWPPIESETIKILGLASNQTLAADLASGVAAVGVWPPMWVELRYGCFQSLKAIDKDSRVKDSTIFKRSPHRVPSHWQLARLLAVGQEWKRKLSLFLHNHHIRLVRL